MPIFICIPLIPPLAALLLAIKGSGNKQVWAWGVFALLVLPLAVGGAGGLILSANGLAWRSCVKLPVGLAYAAGVLALLVWAGAGLWRMLKWRFVRAILLLAGGFLLLAAGWYGLLFSAIWAGSDEVTEYDGQTVVAEQSLSERDYYAYHSALVRGAEILRHAG